MKTFLFTILVLLTPGHSNAQSDTCSLPKIRDLAVGMTTEEIKQHYKNFKMPEPDRYGYAEIQKDFTVERGRYETYSSASESRIVDPLDGLDTTDLAALDVGFFDKRIVTLIFSYKSSIEWRGIGEFVQSLSSALKLPPVTEWSKVDGATLQLRCSENGIIRATLNSRRGGSSIMVAKSGTSDEIRKRRQDEKDRARGTFKP
jgi:hypothetical protein